MGGGVKGGKTPNLETAGQVDPQFFQFLNAITGGNIQRMKDTYKNLGLDTSGTSKGMSPQEATDLNWLQQGAEGTAQQGFLQASQTAQAANQLTLNQIAQQNQLTNQLTNIGNQGAAQAGSAAGSAAAGVGA